MLLIQPKQVLKGQVHDCCMCVCGLLGQNSHFLVGVRILVKDAALINSDYKFKDSTKDIRLLSL